MSRRRFPSLRSGMFATIAMVCASSGAVADPIGLWLARDGAHVDIAPCSNELCGVLASTASPIDPATGRPWADKNNIDPNLRSRPLIGAQVLIAMRPKVAVKSATTCRDADERSASISGQDAFTTGTTVKPIPGNLNELDARTIRVEGCVLSIFCGGART